jgi:serine/threonine protein phosphatase PrpC
MDWINEVEVMDAHIVKKVEQETKNNVMFSIEHSVFEYDGGESYYEDCHAEHTIVINNQQCKWITVLDGHDNSIIRRGKDASVFFRDTIWENFKKIATVYEGLDFLGSMEALIKSCCFCADKLFAEQYENNDPSGGTTLTGVLINLVTGQIIGFNVGDSRVHLNGSCDVDLFLNPKFRTIDDEASLLEGQYGWTLLPVGPKRFKPALQHNISKNTISFGGGLGDANKIYTKIIKRRVRVYDFSMEKNENERWGIVASDGLWDIVSQAPTYVKHIWTYAKKHDGNMNISDIEKWVKYCVGKSVWDNVCVVMFKLTRI